MVDDYKGYVRVVGQEEYDFYEYFVKRDSSNDMTEEELDEKIREYANKVNAVFFLGNKLNLCEPYSFELLRMRMEQENDNRRVKKENGEPVYGLEQFNLQNYFQYVLENLEINIVYYISDNADQAIVKQAREYYESDKETNKAREGVVYEVTMDGKSEVVTVDRTELNFLGKSDMGLADFLERAEVGETYEDVQNGSNREVVVKEITYYESDFSENKTAVIQSYVRTEVYPELIQKIAKNNPVEFELD